MLAAATRLAATVDRGCQAKVKQRVIQTTGDKCNRQR